MTAIGATFLIFSCILPLIITLYLKRAPTKPVSTLLHLLMKAHWFVNVQYTAYAHIQDARVLWATVLSTFYHTLQAYAARHFGVQFLDRRGNDCLALQVLGHTVEVTVLAFFEFSSTRKRSSIVCRFDPVPALGWSEERLVVFCKVGGAVARSYIWRVVLLSDCG